LAQWLAVTAIRATGGLPYLQSLSEGILWCRPVSPTPVTKPNLSPGDVLRLHALDYVLWVADPLLQASVLFFMHKRGLAAQLPFFFGYVTFQAITDIYLLTIERYSYTVYFYSYWTGAALTVLFTFAIIQELFRAAFRSFAAIRNVGVKIFRWGVVLVLIAAVLASVAIHRGNQTNNFLEPILITDRSARAMLCLLTLLVLLGARHLRLSRRSILYGIAMGFVVYMFTKVALDSLLIMHLARSLTVSRTNSAFYLCSCGLWLVYAVYGDKLAEIAVPVAHTDRFPEGQTLMDRINSIVEESMRNARKPK
jgi:hypothetical protein